MKVYTYQEMENYLKNNPGQTCWEISITGVDHRSGYAKEWGDVFFFLSEEEARKFAKDAWSEYGAEDGVYLVYLYNCRWNAEEEVLEEKDNGEDIPDQYKDEPIINESPTK